MVLDPMIQDLDECLTCGIWAPAEEVFQGSCDECNGEEENEDDQPEGSD